MLSKRYKSTEVDRITWLHVPSGTYWSTSSDTHQLVEIKIATSYMIYTLLLNGIINHTYHMRIKGTEPSSVILSQTCSMKN